MIITWENYRSQLPETLWEKFKTLANVRYQRPIIYTGGNLRYATIDEA